MKWLDAKLPLPRLVYNAIGAGYPVPRNLNYFWNFGVTSPRLRSRSRSSPASCWRCIMPPMRASRSTRSSISCAT